MKHLPKWLAERLSQLKNPAADDQPNDSESVEPDENCQSIVGVGVGVGVGVAIFSLVSDWIQRAENT